MLARSTLFMARRAPVTASALRRSLATTVGRRDADKATPPKRKTPEFKTLSEIRSAEDLLGPGAPDGMVPTDLEQSTGLERLELLGKTEGVDIFDMRPLDASRRGTMKDPILVKSAGDEQLAGCTGFPAGSHNVIWLGMSRERPIERCPECGQVYKMVYIGPEDEEHGQGHDYHHLEDPKTFADYVRPDYW